MTLFQFIQTTGAIAAITMIQIGSSWVKQYVRHASRAHECASHGR